MSNSRWKELWMNRPTEQDFFEEEGQSFEAKFLMLKRINGFDILDNGISYAAFVEQYQNSVKNLEWGAEFSERERRVFEIGCGSGANLLLFAKDGYIVGGVDYSEKLISLAKEVLPKANTIEMIAKEAIDMPFDIQYDMVFSNGVFSYFSDLEYAEAVLEKMLKKSKYSLGILDIHDKEKQEEFIAYRRKIIEDYDKRYEGLDKLFYQKQFFIDFAAKHGLKIRFDQMDVTGYWNNDFAFNCYMYQ